MRNEEVIRVLGSVKDAGYDPNRITPNISEESPKERIGIGRWIGSKLKTKAKAIGKKLLVLGTTGATLAGAHYLGKRFNPTYAKLMDRMVVPLVGKGLKAAKEMPWDVGARVLQLTRNWRETAALAGFAVVDHLLSDVELYKKYLQPWVSAFVMWAVDHATIIKTFLKLWAVGGATVKTIGTLFLLVHTVAYWYEPNYRNWFVGLGIPGAIIGAIKLVAEKVPVAVRKLVEMVRKGFDFVKTTIEKVRAYVAKHGNTIMKAGWKVISFIDPRFAKGAEYLYDQYQHRKRKKDN